MSPRLFCDGREISSLEVADDFRSRLRGLLGRDFLHGSFMITRTSSVHTFGMRFAIDVAFVDSQMHVMDVKTIKPNRLVSPRRHARSVVEAPAGAFEQWGIRRGCKLEVRT